MLFIDKNNEQRDNKQQPEKFLNGRKKKRSFN